MHAKPPPRVRYAAMAAEHCALRTASIQLVTVAQALHWFDLPRFFAEVARVGEPGCVIAVWSYSLPEISPEIDRHVHAFYTETVGAYWPAERALVNTGYAGIGFPFRELAPPRFVMDAQWTLAQLAGYLGTWSAVNRYVKAQGRSPVPAFIDSIRPLWGSEERTHRVVWPLEVRAGICEN